MSVCRFVVFTCLYATSAFAREKLRSLSLTSSYPKPLNQVQRHVNLQGKRDYPYLVPPMGTTTLVPKRCAIGNLKLNLTTQRHCCKIKQTRYQNVHGSHTLTIALRWSSNDETLIVARTSPLHATRCFGLNTFVHREHIIRQLKVEQGLVFRVPVIVPQKMDAAKTF